MLLDTSCHKNSHNSCRVCGTQLTDRHDRYCSTDCKQSANERRITKRLRARPLRFCAYCKKEFTYKHKNHAYCSVKCSSEAHSLRMADRETRNFAGTERTQVSLPEMRWVVRERDGNQCSICQVQDKSMGSPQENVIGSASYRRESEEQRPGEFDHSMCAVPSDSSFGALVESPMFSTIAAKRSMSMTSKLKAKATSLLKIFSCTIASSSTTRIPSMT